MFNVIITTNEFGTFFVDINGELVADSATFRRQRGFFNKKTQQWIKAPKFTKKNIIKNPRMVLHLLSDTGLDISWGSWSVEVRF
jgi:hypothetical protein